MTIGDHTQAIRSRALSYFYECGGYYLDHDRCYLYTYHTQGIPACNYKFGVFADGLVCSLWQQAVLTKQK